MVTVLTGVLALAAGPAVSAHPLASDRQAWNPSAPPERLTDFVSTINRSMVTVYCGDALGSGWVAANFAGKDPNGDSYVITNHHVIEECTYAGTRDIEVRQGGVRYAAFVYSWDEDNDLAGLLTRADLPELKWEQVPRPQPGQWVAAFGSPFGLAGSVTTGIVSYVEGSLLTSTAPINPGNSGGPLVDNRGRVVGINTATLEGANGFGIVVGTPLICRQTYIFYCDKAIWTDGESASASLTGQRAGADRVTFRLSGSGISGEDATLYLRRDGKGGFSATQTKMVPANGEVIFEVTTSYKIEGYVTVGSVTTRRVSVPAALFIENTAMPSIIGQPTVGSTLRVSPGSWNPTPDSFKFQWWVGNKRVSSGSKFTVPSNAKGQRVRVWVKASKAGYTPGMRAAQVVIK